MFYRCLILLSAMLIACEVIGAGVLEKRDFLISQDYSLSEQNSPSIAVGPDGRFAVVWADYRYGHGDIFCRLYDSGAVEVGDNFTLNDDAVSAWQFDPDLSSDQGGNYFVVWKDYRNSTYPFDPDIYYQSLDSAGFVGANRNITVETPDSSHQSPAIGVSRGGMKIIAWTDLRHFNWDLFMQIVDSGNAFIGTNTKINDDNSGVPQHEPDLAVSRDGWFAVVWYDSRSGHEDIFIQKYDSSGTPVGGNLRINDDGAVSKQKFPSVAIGGNGTIFIVWLDWRNGIYPDNPDVYGQRLDSNLNRLGGNFIINTDGAQTTQRDPNIAADQWGYVCVVWSDSSGMDWNIKGQLFGRAGIAEGGNFAVNLDSEGKQLEPDLAMDGNHLYFVWADERNENFDIYGRLYQYNDPSLNVSPARVEFVRDRNDPDPAAVEVHLTKTGIDEVNFRIETDQEWISLSKNSGTTPDSFAVAVNTSDLDHGVHSGKVWLIEALMNDTVGYMPVTMTITGPLIEIVPDSLDFRALIEIGAPDEQAFAINNSGSGTLAFTLTPAASWLTMDKTSGTDGEIIQVGCSISSLTAGTYESYIIASDTGAINSAETLSVRLDLYENMPYLAADPEQVSLSLSQGDSQDQNVRIVNQASLNLNWTAYSQAAWLQLQTFNGQADDSFRVTVATTYLEPGIHLDSIRVEDSLAFNSPIYVPIEVTVFVEDTIEIVPSQTGLGNPLRAPLYLNNKSVVLTGILEFQYDKSMLTVDSLSAPFGDVIIEDRTIAIDTVAGTFTVAIQPVVKGSLGPGHYHIGDICGTANETLTGTSSFLADPDIDRFYLSLNQGYNTRPALKGGEVEISIASAADDFESDPLPSRFVLEQNSPNPFNGVTSISFALERSGPVRLVVFNILGQQVDVLVDDYLSAGGHQTSWDGRDYDDRDMATGIYFYRLSTADFSAVRKLVYLK